MIAGNWKMNKSPREAVVLAEKINMQLSKDLNVEVVIAPTLLSLPGVIQRLATNKALKIYAQNCYCKDEGAYTGEVSAKMLKAAAVEGVIIGHSERRSIFKETNALINEKIKAALNHQLSVIFCLGETLAERENGQFKAVIKEQLLEGLSGIESLASVVIAYEPVWAIGTGKTATPNQAEEAHQLIRALLAERFNEAEADQVRILYGGSVNANNARQLLTQPNIDGALIGGASLKEDEFLSIIKTGNQL